MRHFFDKGGYEMNNGLEIARKKQAEKRAAGIKVSRVSIIEKAIRNPKSRSLALKAYYWDFVGCTLNPVTTDLRKEYKGLYTAAQQGGLAATLKNTCLECVGGNDDPGPKLQVKRCQCIDCPLHPVRPWQKISGRKPLINTVI